MRPNAEVERKLTERLKMLTRMLRSHEAETTKRLPSDNEEAVSSRIEMDILEAREGSESREISQVRHALERLKRGEYGICEDCRAAITKERLEAIPESTLCLPCQKRSEEV